MPLLDKRTSSASSNNARFGLVGTRAPYTSGSSDSGAVIGVDPTVLYGPFQEGAYSGVAQLMIVTVRDGTPKTEEAGKEHMLRTCGSSSFLEHQKPVQN
jgi:hypothetical protein